MPPDFWTPVHVYGLWIVDCLLWIVEEGFVDV